MRLKLLGVPARRRIYPLAFFLIYLPKDTCITFDIPFLVFDA